MFKIIDLKGFKIKQSTYTSTLFSSFDRDLLETIRKGDVDKCKELFNGKSFQQDNTDVQIFGNMLAEVIDNSDVNGTIFLQTVGKAIDDPHTDTGAWLYYSIRTSQFSSGALSKALNEAFKNIGTHTKNLYRHNWLFSKNETKDTESKSITSDENSSTDANKTVCDNCDPLQSEAPIIGKVDGDTGAEDCL
ncbi:MAG: hypothetical protein ACJBCI_04880 [Candidatus Tisiphia sp.]|jgi:hypothetical protein|uniref:hypothetical protein n=1 Tax=Candidatus Tisiphia endosymbiont of Melanophora roralis TaxID=3066261 RepID=UPI00312C7F56